MLGKMFRNGFKLKLFFLFYILFYQIKSNVTAFQDFETLDLVLPDSVLMEADVHNCPVEKWILKFIGNGHCNHYDYPLLNSAECDWDGGDCCEETCKSPDCEEPYGGWSFTCLGNSLLGVTQQKPSDDVILDDSQVNQINADIISNDYSDKNLRTPLDFTVNGFYSCAPYSTSNTNDAFQNYVTCSIYACPYSTITASVCSSYTGDTLLRLFDGGTEVLYNDDYCSSGSRLFYTVRGSSCRYFSLRQGCYGSGSCGGTSEITVTDPNTCAPYSASYTDSTTINFFTCSLYVCPGSSITASVCSSYTGDTLLRLFDGSTEVISNDDYCAKGSRLVYTVTGSTCREFSLRQGCYFSESCSGTSAITITSVPSAGPTRNPSVQPTRLPTRIPTQIPSNGASRSPSCAPTRIPSCVPTRHPTSTPTQRPSGEPTGKPNGHPTGDPSSKPTRNPTQPSAKPSSLPSNLPTSQPSLDPSGSPTGEPTSLPTCAAGKFDGDLSSCPPCGLGKYSPKSNMDSCLPCPQGTYQIILGSTECLACPYPMTNLKAGSVDCTAFSLNLPRSTRSIIFSILTILVLSVLLVPSIDPETQKPSWEFAVPMLANLFLPTFNVFSDLNYLFEYKFYNPAIFYVAFIFVLYPIPSFIYLLCENKKLLPRRLMIHPKKCFALGYGQDTENDHIYFPTFFNRRFLGHIAFKEHNHGFAILSELILWVLAIISQIILCVLYVMALFIGGFLSLVWFFFGVLLYMTKAIASTTVWDIWIHVWTGDDLPNYFQTRIDTKLFNQCILQEFFLETFFQIALQCANNNLTETWTPFAYFSTIVSCLMSLNAFWTFVFYQCFARKDKRKDLKDIPVSLPFSKMSVPPFTRIDSTSNDNIDIEKATAVHKDSNATIVTFSKKREKGHRQNQKLEKDYEMRCNAASAPPTISLVERDMQPISVCQKEAWQKNMIDDESFKLFPKSDSNGEHFEDPGVTNKSIVELIPEQLVKSTPLELSKRNSSNDMTEDGVLKLIELQCLELQVPNTIGKEIVDIKYLELNVNEPPGYYVSSFGPDSKAKEVLRVGDKIETIEGQNIERKTLFEILNIINNCRNEFVSFSIVRKCGPTSVISSNNIINPAVEPLSNRCIESMFPKVSQEIQTDYPKVVSSNEKENKSSELDLKLHDNASTKSAISMFSHFFGSGALGSFSLKKKSPPPISNKNTSENSDYNSISSSSYNDDTLHDDTISNQKNSSTDKKLEDISVESSQRYSKNLKPLVKIPEDNIEAKDVFPLYSLLLQQLPPVVIKHPNIHETLLQPILLKLSKYGINSIESLLSFSPTEFDVNYIMKEVNLSRPDAQLVLKMFRHASQIRNEDEGLNREDPSSKVLQFESNVNNFEGSLSTLSLQEVPENSTVLTMKSGRTRRLSQEDAVLLQFAKSAQQSSPLLQLPPNKTTDVILESNVISFDVMKSGRTRRLSQEDAELLQLAKSAQQSSRLLLSPNKTTDVILESNMISFDVILGSDIEETNESNLRNSNEHRL